jgi:hypothetical protein
MRSIADREHWRHKLQQAQDLATGPPDENPPDLSATEEAA